MKRDKLRRVIASSMVASMIVTSNFTALPLANEAEVTTVTETKTETKTDTKRSIMYYGDWSVWGGQDTFYPQHIPAEQLTHLNFAFLDFDAEGNLQFTDEDAAIGSPVGQPGVQWNAANAGILVALQELRERNPNLKLGVSLGGWSKSGDFTHVARDPEARANFIANILDFIEYTNMDYVDLDWEYPAEAREPDFVDNAKDEGTPDAIPEDKENYITLLEELRVALDEQGVEIGKDYELSVALPAPKSKVEPGIDIERLFDVVDFANVMTYDMRGAWDPVSGHQTGLYTNPNDPLQGNNLSIDESVQHLIDNGAEPDKIVIGAAYYTRGWDSVDAGDNPELPGLFGEAEKTGRDADQAPTYGAPNEAPLKSGDGGRQGGIWSYRNLDEIRAKYPGIKEYWDDEAKAPYLYDEATGVFFTYDNARSIGEKADYVHEHELGGMIGWMASQDAPTTDPNVRDELTKATKEGLFGDAELPDHEIVYSDLDVSVTMGTYDIPWGPVSTGYEITIHNNERVDESNTVLKAVERSAETIKAPKLYIKTDKALTGDYTAGAVSYENGYVVVDLNTVWDAKTIEQGKSYTFKLQGDAEIESIELVQRMSDSGPEMYRQTIFGDVAPEANAAPVLSGINNKSITVGSDFDALAGVKALDKEDGDLTSNIEVSGTVDTNKIGKYTLTYTITDSEGLTTTKTRVIEVKEEVNEAPELDGVANKTITVGESFDKMAGVTALDKEDGDLTSKITVTGDVNVDVEGTYEVTYSVTDSKGLETTAVRTITVEEEAVVAPEEDNEGSNFGVGQGIEWPEQVFAPFADMAAWNNGEFSNNGALNLAKISEDTGVKFFNLGFIQATGGVTDGALNWGWGGYGVLNEDNADNSQYQGIKQSIIDVRELGGDVTISLGGLTGTALWEASQDVDVLYNTYKEIVEGYGLTRLDLDIEGPAQNKEHNRVNAQAIKRLQDDTGVDIVLTLAVLPSGLTQSQLDVLEVYLAAGVDVELVNIMTMCYGPATLLPGENYGTASLRAVDSTKDQLQEYFKKYAGIELTDAEAYKKLGTTPSVGFEGSAHPIFPASWSKLVVDHAIDRELGMVSMWSINRDSMAQPNQGITSAYEHTNLFKQFGSDEVTTPGPVVNQAPKLNGVTNVTITEGDSFDKMAGVTATDKEDGNLTSKIVVTGTVDTNKAGTYKLTYKVTDSEGLTTTLTRTVTVVEKVNNAPVISGAENKTIKVGESFDAMAGVTATDAEDGNLTSEIVVTGTVDTNKVGTYTVTYTVTDSEGKTTTKIRTITVKDASATEDTWVRDKIYYGEEIVIYNGEEYKAKWWTQGEEPDTSAAWEKIVKPNEDGSVSWYPGMVAVGGDKVLYNGVLYEAKWWTQSTPGSDDSWKLAQ